MFETSFWPYLALRMLQFLMCPLERSSLTHIVHFHRLYLASVTIRLSFLIRYFNTLFKAAKIISLAFIICKLLAVKQSHPTVKCNIEKNIFT